MTTATAPVVTLIERPICEGSQHCVYTMAPYAAESITELAAAIKTFQQKLNPYKGRRPRTGWANFTLKGHEVHLDVREAARGYGLHARATFLLDGKRATWPQIAKALS
jgi:hypothetical protein